MKQEGEIIMTEWGGYEYDAKEFKEPGVTGMCS